jgi:putative ABC transport system substrate-binding protein
MISRRLFFAALVAVAAPLDAAGVRRIGWLVAYPPSDRRGQVFRETLVERGWVEGRDFTLEWKPSHGKMELVEQVAREFVQAKVELIVAANTANALAAQRASGTVPIVMLTSGFPVEAGLATSLAHPGRNVTGNAIYAGTEVFGKLVELLREVVPRMKALGVLWDYAPPAFPDGPLAIAELERAARRFGVQLVLRHVRVPAELDPALDALAAARVDALFVTSGPVYFPVRDRIVAFLRDHKLPSASDWVFLPEHREERLLVYAPDPLDLARQAADYVDRIFKGARPGNLPIQLPSKFVLTVNLKMARAFGMSLPLSLLQRADDVIQ